MSKIEELDKEIAEMEAVLQGGETTPEKGTQAAPKEEKDVTTEVADPKPVRNNWKKSYTDLRSHHDGTIFELRSELANVKQQRLDMQEEMEKMRSTIPVVEDPTLKLSQEESDILGKDAISAIDKMNQQATNPLKEELATERKLRTEAEAREVERMRTANTQLFLSKLGKEVSDFAEIDLDPKFMEYMGGVDLVSGQLRKTLFKTAERLGDVGRVASFFKEFKSLADPLEGHITPTGTTGTPAPTSGKDYVSRADIDNFYNRASRGEYKNNMAQFHKQEALYDKALMDGRVR